MARDAGVRNIEELREFGKQMQDMGEYMYSVMLEAKNRMAYVSEGWQDDQNEQFKVYFDESVETVRQMSEEFSLYNDYIQQISDQLEEYKGVRLK